MRSGIIIGIRGTFFALVLLAMLSGAGLPTAGGGDGEVGLVFPLARPGLARPTLQGDGADRRAVFITDDLAPRPRIRRANLGGTLAHAKQTLTAGCQAGNGSPILSA